MKKLLLLACLLLPFFSFSQLRNNRTLELLGGLAINDGSSGYHLQVTGGWQGKTFGLGVYTSFLNTPSNKFSNWTILGLQTKVRVGDGSIKPYGVFDFGLFNFQTINDDVNMRTASLDLGGGIDKELNSGNGFLLDARWKWLVDYAGKRDAIGVFTLSVGMRF
jgi:hypothetical protein